MHEARHRHHHREPGGPPFHGRHGWGGGWFGPPWAVGRRARRGDVRTALLAVLSEQPMHGYDVMRELEERSGGVWRPSPGSIYPTLQLLQDEGLVTSEERDGKRVFSITDAGRTEFEVRSQGSGGVPPWEFGGGESLAGLRDAVFQLAAAAMQVARAGSSAQVERAVEVVGEARRKIYAILSEG